MQQNELQHYGVPGMKWGVRKTPAEKVKRYQEKQYKKIDRRYGVEAHTKRSAKRLEEFDAVRKDKYATDKEKSRAAKKATAALTRKYMADGLSYIEKSHVSKMTLSDIRKEQVQKGALYTAAFLAAPMLVGFDELRTQMTRGVNSETTKAVTESSKQRAYEEIQRRR